MQGEEGKLHDAIDIAEACMRAARRGLRALEGFLGSLHPPLSEVVGLGSGG